MRPDRIVNFLARPLIVVYTLPWLMVLLVLGTVAQRYAGLYISEHLFFSSFIFWFWGIPFPGMLSVLALLGVSLLAKIILKSPWRRSMIGTLITHLGVLLLLLGGLVTAATSYEGNMVLAPQEQQSYFADYHRRELAVQKNGADIGVWPWKELHAGKVLSGNKIPFPITVQKTCRNCDVVRNRNESVLTGIPPSKTDESNVSGLAFSAGGDSYIALESAPPVKITSDHDVYQITLRKHPFDLPFALRLDEVREDTYPATDIAREYESLVTVTDGAVHWQARIRMNEPLRYRGYTFYQAEVDRIGDQPFSVLAVVRNTGRVFPYISGLVLCLGLALHLILTRKTAAA